MQLDDPTSEPTWFRRLADALLVIWIKRDELVGGYTLIVCGLMMIAFLFGVATLPANDIFTVIGLFIVVEGYTIVATLMLTMGLRKLLGPNNRIDRFLNRSWWRVVVWVVGSSLIVAGCWLIAVW